MFSRKKITAVSALLAGLAATCAGATQAYAGVPSGDCTRDAQGNRTCIHKSKTVYKSQDGRYVVTQTQDCSTISRQFVVWPANGLLNRRTTKIGPTMDCSNTASSPKGFEKGSQNTRLCTPTAVTRPKKGDALRPSAAARH